MKKTQGVMAIGRSSRLTNERHAATAQLPAAAGKERLHHLFANLAGMAYRCRPDNRLTMELVSEGCVALTGCSTTELLLRPHVAVGDLIHPDDAARVRDELRASLNEQRMCSTEYRIHTAAGAEKWVWDQAQGLYAEDGRLLAIEGFISDVTARKALEVENEKFALLAKNSNDFIAICDMQLVPIYANDSALRIVGLKELEAFKKVRVQDCFFPDDQAYIMQEFLPGVLQSGTGTVEIRFRHFTTGAAIWMNYSVFTLKAADGVPVGFATVSRNITERKRAEEELRQTAVVFESAAEAIVITDAAYRTISVNPTFTAITGYPAAEVLGRDPCSVLWRAAEEESVQWRQVVATGRWQGERICYCKDGSRRALWVSKSAVKDAAGQVTHFAIMLSDIT
ncbi:MAG: PAS domain-containing protein, partial [Gammaproteobacteria bacterium]